MNKRLLTIVCALLMLAPLAQAQGLKDVKINEVLVNNVDSYEDDFGVKVSWIELYNSGYASANLASAHLRFISGGDTTTYKVPASDARTLVPAQGYVIFFADGSANKGTFYTNFHLGDSTYSGKQVIELLDQSGKQVLDSFEYDMSSQVADVTYGRHKDPLTGEVTYERLDHITPLQANEMEEPIKKSDVFLEEDPNGTAMAATAMSVVFSALIMLYFVFNFVGKVYKRSAARKNAAKEVAVKSPVATTGGSKVISGEVVAAISVALRLYEEDLHDNESNVITINKVARAYSPWSSKIYSIRETPNKKTW
ncbi:MAG: OadG family transporter subunit [Rikenellaceae bacterium]